MSLEYVYVNRSEEVDDCVRVPGDIALKVGLVFREGEESCGTGLLAHRELSREEYRDKVNEALGLVAISKTEQGENND